MEVGGGAKAAPWGHLNVRAPRCRAVADGSKSVFKVLGGTARAHRTPARNRQGLLVQTSKSACGVPLKTCQLNCLMLIADYCCPPACSCLLAGVTCRS